MPGAGKERREQHLIYQPVTKGMQQAQGGHEPLRKVEDDGHWPFELPWRQLEHKLANGTSYAWLYRHKVQAASYPPARGELVLQPVPAKALTTADQTME